MAALHIEVLSYSLGENTVLWLISRSEFRFVINFIYNFTCDCVRSIRANNVQRFFNYFTAASTTNFTCQWMAGCRKRKAGMFGVLHDWGKNERPVTRTEIRTRDFSNYCTSVSNLGCGQPFRTICSVLFKWCNATGTRKCVTDKNIAQSELCTLRLKPLLRTLSIVWAWTMVWEQTYRGAQKGTFSLTLTRKYN
jgi:hypothetical protein